MSFFNLTRLGYQDPIKAAVTRTGTTPLGDQCDKTESTTGAPRTTLSEPVYPNSQANGSYVKYTRRLHKHIRPKLGKILLRMVTHLILMENLKCCVCGMFQFSFVGTCMHACFHFLSNKETVLTFLPWVPEFMFYI